jgi:hypothetical protein
MKKKDLFNAAIELNKVLELSEPPISTSNDKACLAGIVEASTFITEDDEFSPETVAVMEAVTGKDYATLLAEADALAAAEEGAEVAEEAQAEEEVAVEEEEEEIEVAVPAKPSPVKKAAVKVPVAPPVKKAAVPVAPKIAPTVKVGTPVPPKENVIVAKKTKAEVTPVAGVQKAAAVKPERKQKAAAVKEPKVDQTSIIRKHFRKEITLEQCLKELQAMTGKDEKWAKTRMGLYTKAYGKAGENDPKL